MKKISFAKICGGAAFFGISIFAIFATILPQKVFAETTNSTDVIVKILGKKPSIKILEPAENFATKNDNFSLKIEVEGAGEIVIFDQKGNVVFHEEKTDSAREILETKIKFSENPGEYIFTAKITADDDQFASAQIKIRYDATRVPIVEKIAEKFRGKIAPPNTGNYVKIFGKSFLMDEIFWTIGVSVLIFGAGFFSAKKIKNSRKNSAKK